MQNINQPDMERADRDLWQEESANSGNVLLRPRGARQKVVAKAQKKRAAVSIESLINELNAPEGFDIVEARKKILREFDTATTSDQRAEVLAIFKATMDLAERNLADRGDQAQLLAGLQKARAYDYKVFIVQECTVGLDTPVVGGDISVDMLMAVTNREIAAGRMTEDHSLRKIAVNGAAAPHMSHAELLARHAKLKADALEQSKAVSAPKTLGQKLKGLFGK